MDQDDVESGNEHAFGHGAVTLRVRREDGAAVLTMDDDVDSTMIFLELTHHEARGLGELLLRWSSEG